MGGNRTHVMTRKTMIIIKTHVCFCNHYGQMIKKNVSYTGNKNVYIL